MSHTDRDHIWHPFTRHFPMVESVCVDGAKGGYLHTSRGTVMDLISSWWVSVHGHGNPELAEAMYQQGLSMEHVIFAGFTHKPATDLVNRLSKHVGDHLTRYFFSDNGSTSVEIALKMAYQFYVNSSEVRSKFIAFDGSYHGDTFGCMSVSHSGFHDIFRPLCFNVDVMPWPEYYIGCDEDELHKRESITLKILKDSLDGVCAVICEPLVQGAGGMRMVRPEFLQKVVEIAHEHNVLVIFDEVMTGFYRTGTMFAKDQISVEPDFMCISKGLTGGTLPMSLTITSEEVFSAFVSIDATKMFAHGHSYTANPIGCAVSIKSLEILERPETQQNISNVIKAQENGTQMLLELQNKTGAISMLRRCGVIVAFNVESASVAREISQKMFERGFLVRNLSEVLYILPPYCLTQDELTSAYDALCAVISDVTRKA